ncbi:MAG: sugar phosphate nucleotidyltransferase [Prevotellaceae bacterium]|nr:sugar phosphate nucleotidyltransferase [Prevotellaceae bacterium]MDY2633708.1 sugar phosphate nucleotidyltransferase [Prevotella sp.]
MKPTLLLLAAGMGSRYGGLKQLDGVGPHGETIMDYSIFDAIKAGFGKIVFVIRKDFEDEFRSKILSKYQGHVDAEIVFQAIDKLPEGFTCPAGRVKPWGTNHAVMMAADVIKEPFCVINCDDFYSRDAFMVIGKYLAELPDTTRNEYAMVGFHIGNTLSENGTVARGICSVDERGCLTNVVERTEIRRMDGQVKYKDGQGEWVAVDGQTPVSMNVWGFTPDYFEYSRDYFREFLSDKANLENIKSEFYIPLMVNKLIQDNTASVRILETKGEWFGVTYAADREETVKRIAKLVEDGIYPADLF